MFITLAGKIWFCVFSSFTCNGRGLAVFSQSVCCLECVIALFSFVNVTKNVFFVKKCSYLLKF